MTAILGYIAIVQVLLTFGSFYFFMEISKLNLTRRRPWFLFALAFLLGTYRRIYNYSTIKSAIHGGYFSIDFIVKVVIPFVTSILIFVALYEIYHNFRKNYKLPSDRKYDEIIHDKNT